MKTRCARYPTALPLRTLLAPGALLALLGLIALVDAAIGGSAVARAGLATQASQLKVHYLVKLAQEDRPEIDVVVSGVPAGTTRTTLKLVTEGSTLGAIPDLKPIFKVTSAFSSSGSPLEWAWDGSNLVVQNGSSSDFTLRYQLDALNLCHPGEGMKFVAFRRDVLFFVASDVFPLVQGDPVEITVRLELPDGLVVFSNLENMGGVFTEGGGTAVHGRCRATTRRCEEFRPLTRG